MTMKPDTEYLVLSIFITKTTISNCIGENQNLILISTAYRQLEFSSHIV